MSERKGTKALELWCKRLVKDCPNVQIDNMTTSWRNGIAFCALVNHFRPDLIDMSTLKPENIYYNNQLAFNIAETQLGIPALLDPEDMVENEIPDRLSILTYLSQFYQRLGNTGPSKTTTENNQKEISTVSPIRNSPMKLKSGYDKCSICELPVYLAQRLIVSNKLYHRRCFRCAKCDGQLSPNSSFDSLNGSEFWCDSCKSEKAISKYLNNNNDCMGMLNFTQRLEKDSLKEEGATMQNSEKPKSILEKINMFEKGFGDNENINDKIEKLSLREERKSLVKPEQINSEKHIMINNGLITTDVKEASNKNLLSSTINTNLSTPDVNSEINKANDDTDNSRPVQFVDKLYKSDINKFNFLQTQLSSDLVEEDVSNPPQLNNIPNPLPIKNESIITVDNISSSNTEYQEHSKNLNTINMTDEYRLASNTDINNKFDTEDDKTKDSSFSDTFEGSINENKTEIKEVIPPRRKTPVINNKAANTIQNKQKSNESVEAYPDHLNPFSDEENEVIKKPVSTNPFGSSDEEENDISISVPNSSNMQASTPIKRLIPVLNPFWSDGEEPSSEDEHSNIQSSENMYSRSSITTSTPNFPSTTPRKKSRAPPPPTIMLVKATENDSHLNSMEDVASLSSVSSYCSTVNSDLKASEKLTPRPKKKRPAPTPSDSISYLSTGSRDFHKSNTDITDKSNDLLGHVNHTDGCTRKVKGPAPGLPLPERREVKPQISPEELQVQLDLLEAQQVGLERQGVLIEQMIRDRCEGDESTSVSQEEVEDLVIQLCELVNEKNDLFRKQTELMYIRRQQRLEQEQADIEHEIRIIQSRPAVNRIDADKAREEHLVSRLVEIVRLRDELVQQMDSERRREIQEDLAIAASIAERRAQRNSDSNTSSMTSVETGRTNKKTKVKDKVRKQLKKAKHSLNIKKKEEQDGHAKEKEKNPEKNHKTKWF